MATLYFGTTLINQAEANVATVVESLTKAEYDALAVKDPNTLYVLTDVEGPVTMEQMNAAIAAIPTPDVSGQINDHNTSATSHSDIRTELANKAPMYTYGTEDLTAGSSPLATGQLHFVYE